MSPPRWACALLAWLAGPGQRDEVVGDLEEAHRRRLTRHGRIPAALLSGVEALDMAVALLRLRARTRGRMPRGGRRERTRRVSPPPRLSGVSWLDLKLGLRLLVKHPGLSLVSVVGMAVAVAIGAASFTTIRAMTASPLPLEEGERIVTVQNVGARGFEQARRTHLHHLETWREEADALADVGAYRVVRRNVVMDDGVVAPARVVEMTASGFRIARVPPLMGRWLLPDDERPGASAVVVIGHGVWRERFGERPDVIGRTLRIGGTTHAVVGVMPPGFAFPINNRVWTPLRLDPADYELGGAPPIAVFARLAPGAGMEEAQAQLHALGLRAAAADPESLEGLRTGVVPYTQGGVLGNIAWVLYLVELLVSMLLVVIAINVGALVYARTVARTGEIAVRTALGASRARIASQLFAEAFLLSSAAAALGLLGARFAARRVELHLRSSRGEEMPFWWDFGLSAEAVLYGLGLAALAAVIIGVVPALGVTGRRLRLSLQSVGSGASGPGLGRTWTALIVAQIAVAVAVLPVALSAIERWSATRAVSVSSSSVLDEVLVARLELDTDVAAPGAPPEGEADRAERYARLLDALSRRFEAMPEVVLVARTAVAPWEDPDYRFELDGQEASPAGSELELTMESASTGSRVGRSVVGLDFFQAFDIPVLAGRGLRAGDAASEAPPVVVNRAFMDLVTAGASPLGRRIRFPSLGPEGGEAPWHTIVGVVQDMERSGMANPEAKAYLPMAGPGDRPASFAIRMRGDDAGRTAARLRQAAVGIEPMLRLEGMETLAARHRRGAAMTQLTVVTIAVLSLATLMLAVAGLYALMSFTVARRHREIGIRTALGARPQRVMSAVLWRAARQLAMGIALGLAFAAVVDRVLGGEMLGGKPALWLALVGVLMAAVGILAAWGPARRGLRVQPTEALRAG